MAFSDTYSMSRPASGTFSTVGSVGKRRWPRRLSSSALVLRPSFSGSPETAFGSSSGLANYRPNASAAPLLSGDETLEPSPRFPLAGPVIHGEFRSEANIHSLLTTTENDG